MATWTVTLTRMNAGKPDTITRDNIQASTQQEAVQKAQMGIPNAAQYTQVQATQKDIQGNPLAPTDQDQDQTLNQPYTGQFHESLFPYKLMLPLSDAAILEESRIPNVKVVRRDGKIYIEVSRPDDLALFIKKLLEIKDIKAKRILNGIWDSMR